MWYVTNHCEPEKDDLEYLYLELAMRAAHALAVGLRDVGWCHTPQDEIIVERDESNNELCYMIGDGCVCSVWEKPE
jgi:hypothetical protein